MSGPNTQYLAAAPTKRTNDVVSDVEEVETKRRAVKIASPSIGDPGTPVSPADTFDMSSPLSFSSPLSINVHGGQGGNLSFESTAFKEKGAGGAQPSSYQRIFAHNCVISPSAPVRIADIADTLAKNGMTIASTRRLHVLIVILFWLSRQRLFSCRIGPVAASNASPRTHKSRKRATIRTFLQNEASNPTRSSRKRWRCILSRLSQQNLIISPAR